MGYGAYISVVNKTSSPFIRINVEGQNLMNDLGDWNNLIPMSSISNSTYIESQGLEFPSCCNNCSVGYAISSLQKDGTWEEFGAFVLMEVENSYLIVGASNNVQVQIKNSLPQATIQVEIVNPN